MIICLNNYEQIKTISVLESINSQNSLLQMKFAGYYIFLKYNVLVGLTEGEVIHLLKESLRYFPFSS